MHSSTRVRIVKIPSIDDSTKSGLNRGLMRPTPEEISIKEFLNKERTPTKKLKQSIESASNIVPRRSLSDNIRFASGKELLPLRLGGGDREFQL